MLEICRSAIKCGVPIELIVGYGKPFPHMPFSVQSHNVWKWPPRIDICPSLYRSIKKKSCSGTVALIHSHGVWNISTLYAGLTAYKYNLAHILSPHGSLCPGALSVQSRLKKALAWILYQNRVLHSAACLHVTSYGEYNDLRSLGLDVPVAIIPLGVDIPYLSTKATKVKGLKRHRLFFFSRITAKKGIDNLLKAWVVIQDQFPNWELHITGPDDRGYQADMISMAKSFAVERVSFTGPVYGENKTHSFINADIFILPTRSENFSIAVAEALAHGVPAIVTKGAPWEGLVTNDCGWWIDVGVDPLIECLKTALAESPETLREMGARGRMWMKQDFTWAEVGRKMKKTYEWLIKKGTPPPWIEVD